MLRRSLFVSALMLAGVVGFASSAKAAPDTETVIMSGNVDNSCTVDNPVPGTLVPNIGKDILDSASGTSGKVDIACTGAASLEITSVTKTSGASTTDTVATLTTSLGDAILDSVTPANDKDITVTGAGLPKETANVNLTASNTTVGTALTAGTYTYEVLITATPN